MDVHVPRPVTRGLRRREVDVLTAQEDNTARWEDPDLLNRAGTLERVLVSQDEDLLIEAAKREDAHVPRLGTVKLPRSIPSLASSPINPKLYPVFPKLRRFENSHRSDNARDQFRRRHIEPWIARMARRVGDAQITAVPQL